MWANRSDEQRNEIGSKMSEALAGRQNRLGKPITRNIGNAYQKASEVKSTLDIEYQ